MHGGCVTDLPAEVIAAYDAPFPDETYKQGARQFPLLVPTTPDDPATAANRSAWNTLRRFERPFLCAFSDSDAITKGTDTVLRTEIPGAAGQAYTTIVGAGHFLQEDQGPRTRPGCRSIRGRHRERIGKRMTSSDRQPF